MKDNLFKTYSNKEIAQLLYDEFVSDNSLTDDNVRKEFDSFEELFWSRLQIEDLSQIPELDKRQEEISDIVWFRIIEFEKELVLKRNKVLNTKSNEDLAEMLYVKEKTLKSKIIDNKNLIFFFSIPDSSRHHPSNKKY